MDENEARWRERCEAAAGLRTVSLQHALDYLIGSKFSAFVGMCKWNERAATEELPVRLRLVREVFSEEEIRSYLKTLDRPRRMPLKEVFETSF